MRSSKDEKKAAKERDVFHSFAKAVGWNIEPQSVRSPDEKNAPDVTADLPSGTIAFELLSATTPEFKQVHSNAQVIYPDPLPIDQKLLKKIQRGYESQFPIELLMHFSLSMDTDDLILWATQNILWNEGVGKFQRIWYFGETGRVFLWHNNWWSEINVSP